MYYTPVVSDSREEDVFKVFRASNNEVWETDFLISCSPLLEEYSKNMFLGDSSREANIYRKNLHRKLDTIKQCLRMLD